MGLFRKATRTAGRVAKNVAREAVFGDLESDGKKGGKGLARKADKAREKREYEEYRRLKEKFEPKDEATMRAEWKAYYDTSCEGDCESCPYYDWCPDDFEDEAAEEAAQDAREADGAGSEPERASEPDGESAPEPELTEQEQAAKAAAEAFYEEGCDGACETCVHYDWCPAEEEGESDDKVVVMGMTQGEMKDMAKGSVELAREGALAAKELKEAMDDIMGGLDLKKYLK